MKVPMESIMAQFAMLDTNIQVICNITVPTAVIPNIYNHSPLVTVQK